MMYVFAVTISLLLPLGEFAFPPFVALAASEVECLQDAAETAEVIRRSHIIQVWGRVEVSCEKQESRGA